MRRFFGERPVCHAKARLSCKGLSCKGLSCKGLSCKGPCHAKALDEQMRVVCLGFTPCDTMRQMKTITLRELHEQTGRWVRQASDEEVHVADRGRLIAKIVPASPLPTKPFFANPRFRRAYLA